VKRCCPLGYLGRALEAASNGADPSTRDIRKTDKVEKFPFQTPADLTGPGCKEEMFLWTHQIRASSSHRNHQPVRLPCRWTIPSFRAANNTS